MWTCIITRLLFLPRLFMTPPQEIASKLPNIESTLTRAVPLDTLYSLLADADFEKHQEEMDRMLEPFTREEERRSAQ